MNPMSHSATGPTTGSTTSPAMLVLSWALVVIPLLYGVYMTLLSAMALFTD
jgi:hypothetical protein